MNQQLTTILSRIYFRMENDEWDLTEDEYKILDGASGEEIASIAYHKRYNLQTLIKKADDLIEEHNGAVQRKLLRQLKSIKLDLLSSVPRKRPQAPKPDPQEIDRRILEEAIEEVTSIEPPPQPQTNDNQDDYDWHDINIEDVLKQKQLIGGPKSSASFAQNVPHSSTPISALPSLHRDGSVSLEPISIREVIATTPDVNNLIGVTDFSDPTNEEMAQIGMLIGETGRKLYNKINNIESTRPSMISALQVPEPDIQGIHTPSRNETSMTELGAPLTPKDLLAPETSQALVAPHEVPASPSAQEAPLQHSAVSTPTTTNQPKAPSKVDIFMEIASKLEMKRSKERQQRRKQLKTIEVLKTSDETMELNKPLVWHNNQRKAKKIKLFKNHTQLHIEMDLLEYLEDVEPDLILENVLEPEPESASMEKVQMDSNVPLMELDDIPNYNAPVGEESFVAKKARLDLAEAENSMEPPARQSMEPPARQSMEPPARQSMEPPTDMTPDSARMKAKSSIFPRGSSLAPILESATRTDPTETSKQKTDLQNRVSTRKKMTVEEVEFQHWQFESQKSVEASQNILEKQKKDSHHSIISGDIEEGVDATGKVLYKIYTDEKGERRLRFVGVGGRVENCMEYCAEVYAVYLQMRIIMRKANQWKMSFDSLLPKLQLLDANAEKGQYESRLLLLHEYGFIEATMTEDDKHILEVEIPVRQNAAA